MSDRAFFATTLSEPLPLRSNATGLSLIPDAVVTEAFQCSQPVVIRVKNISGAVLGASKTIQVQISGTSDFAAYNEPTELSFDVSALEANNFASFPVNAAPAQYLRVKNSTGANLQIDLFQVPHS